MRSAIYTESHNVEYQSHLQPKTINPSSYAVDEQLIERCKHGDRAAFEEFLRRYERRIHSLAFHLAKNHDDAQDIAAEASVRIYQAFPNFKHIVTLTAWINRIVVNVYRDMRRRSQRQPSVSLDLLVTKSGDVVFADDTNHAQSPQAYVEEKERKTILQTAISALPLEQKKLVTLYHHEGRTYEEIAGIMGVPLGTVKSRLNRVRLALRKQLGSQLPALVN